MWSIAKTLIPELNCLLLEHIWLEFVLREAHIYLFDLSVSSSKLLFPSWKFCSYYVFQRLYWCLNSEIKMFPWWQKYVKWLEIWNVHVVYCFNVIDLWCVSEFFSTAYILYVKFGNFGSGGGEWIWERAGIIYFGWCSEFNSPLIL